jgi:hypothetical protein
MVLECPLTIRFSEEESGHLSEGAQTNHEQVPFFVQVPGTCASHREKRGKRKFPGRAIRMAAGIF